MNSYEAVIKDVLAAEEARRTALIQDDHQALEQLLADDLVYVHTSGLIHTKAQYVDYARTVVTYLNVERGDLQVRVHGDTAIMTGTQVNTMKKRSEDNTVRGEGFVTQVWVRGSGGWRIASFHGSRLAQ
jgi:ketosteroid isomerase-like protein